MGQLYNKLAAIKRISKAIKCYHQTLADRQIDSEASMDVYLIQQLSVRDWLLWKRLQKEPNEPLVDQREFHPEEALFTQQFSLLLGQYKRAGFELYQVWCQSQQVVEWKS